jgi:hypothetical protein
MSELDALYERLYAIDLVYQQDCFKLCGDAHCCSFARHKRRFGMLAKRPFQELPLLPGEFAFLAARGWLAQFAEHERKASVYAIDARRALLVDAVISMRPGGCACDHDTRPVVCRLYPLLPAIDEAGRLASIEPFGVYEELERLEGLAPACQIHALPLDQLQLLLEVTRLLALSPLVAFHLAAYRVAKRHVFDRLRAARKPGESAFGQFEWSMLRKRLFDHDALRAELAALADRYAAHWGAAFALPSPEAAERRLTAESASVQERGARP